MTASAAVWAGTVPFLLLVWLVQRIPGVRGIGGLLFASVIAVGAILIEWFGRPLPFWSAGLSANFSVVMAVLLGVAIWERACGSGIFRAPDWSAAWISGAVASLLLYPSALGLGPQNFDAYALGWPWLFRGPSLLLFAGTGLASALLVWRGNRFGYVVLLALLGYAAGFQESDNLWDYLLDPVFGAVSLLVVLWNSLRRLTPRSRR